MTQDQVLKELEKNRNYFLTNDFLKEITKYYDVVEIREDCYFLPELDYEIEIQ